MTTLDDALADLAIFPLPDVVLFPGSALPLHVFEPRYVAMTRDVVAGSRVMGIVRLLPGYEADYLGRPPVERIATAAEVIACQEIPGDRFALLVRGAARVRIERELPPARPYRQVVAGVLEDHPVDEAAVTVARAELAALCDQLAGRVGEAGAAIQQVAHGGAPTSELTMALAGALVQDPDERQALLALRDAAARLERLIGHASDLLVSLGPGPAPGN